jgi:transposase
MAVRWLIVWKVCMFGMSHRDVRRELTGFNLDGEAPSLGTISTVARRYRRTGGVQTWQGQRNAAAANRRMSDNEELQLVRQLIDCPHATLIEHRQKLEIATGVRVSRATICRAVWRMGYRRTKARAGRPPARPPAAPRRTVPPRALVRSCRTSRATSTFAAPAPSGTRS